jgi:PAS domain S-box-containing protein
MAASERECFLRIAVRLKNRSTKMNEELRKTGVDIIGEVSWGTHFCLFYQTKADLFEILVPYFKAGLENNEFCMWITSPPPNEGEAIEAIRRAIPNFNQYLENGQIEVLPHTEWYLKEGEFNIQVVLDRWGARLNQALSKGYEGLRVAGSMFLGKEDWKKVVDYEEEVKEVIGRYPMMAICVYSIDKCGPREVIDVAANHRFILIKKNAIWELIESSRLKRTEEALRRSEEQLRLITDSLPVLISYIDSEQCYRFVNKAYENWYGVPCGEIYGRHIKEVLGESAYQVIQGYVERVLSGRQIIYEALVPYKSGGIRYVSAIYVPNFDEQGKVKGFFALVTDITEKKKAEEQLIKYRDHLEELVEEQTAKYKIANEQLQQEIIERKQAEEALQEGEERYRILFETSPDAIALSDLNFNIITVNQPALMLFGYESPKEVIGKNALEFVAKNERSRVAEDATELLKTGRVKTAEYSIQIKDGTLVPAELRASLIRDAEGKVKCFIAVIRNISERKASEEKIRVYEEQLRSLVSEMTLLEERERRRIANDLHDNIGQTLAISKIKLGELRESVSPSLVKPLSEIHELIEETIQYTRSLTFELSPPILYELGFEAAVEWLAEQIQEKHGISVDFEDDLQPKPMEEEIRVLLFKAVSELLTNVVKHAQAHKAKVAIQREGSNIRITVEDDGIGFYIPEANQLAGVHGFGLFSIRERLRHFGGSLQIQSGPRRGTLITLLAPLKQKEKRQGV